MMNQPKKDIEIPGYYWNPETRRYYREDPVNPRPRVLPTRSHPHPVISAKHVLEILNKRQIGFGKKSFENQTVALRLRNFKLVQSCEVVNNFPGKDDVKYLKGGNASIYVEWTAGPQSYFLEEKEHSFTYKNISDTYIFEPPHLSSLWTVDLCERLACPGYLLRVVTNSHRWNALIIKKVGQIGNVTYENRHTQYSSSLPIWCCDSNNFSKYFALGRKNKIDLFDDLGHKQNRHVKGEVRSIQFDKEGSIVYTGLHTGQLGMVDLRKPGSVFYSKIHDIGIDETVLLSNEYHLICGAFDGMLCKVDLRMRKPACQYFEHVHNPRKVPFCVNEPSNMLCATGTDNVTRLWSLSGGAPLKCIKPPIEGVPCRSWLVSDGFTFLVHQFQKATRNVYNCSYTGW